MADEASQPKLRFLEDRWDADTASRLDGPELLRYRSNLLGSDLRITNFGGGNTSSKLEQVDPVGGGLTKVLWVKGSGGDLGSIKRAGFATLYLDRLLQLETQYKGVAEEDAMAALYPLVTFGNNPTVASIDTPLHAFLPFPHVDHLHPDWAIALAASANGKARMEEFNKEFGHRLAWLPWQRPGFELGLMLRRIVAETPHCDGVVLGGHGLFTWGNTQRACYLNTLMIIDQLGQFIERQRLRKGHKEFGGARVKSRSDRHAIATAIMPVLRGAVSRRQRWIGAFIDSDRVMDFVNSEHAEELAHLGTSCPDHFIRTKIRPMFLKWDPCGDPAAIPAVIETALDTYRSEYAEYYEKYAEFDSPKQRDASPMVVLLPGVGMFTFGKNKTDARLTGEFYINAIGVMRGAGALGGGEECTDVPQAGPAATADQFGVFDNYVALPPKEAFRIEYWSLEDAKIRRQPAEKQLSRKIALIVGDGSGLGRQAALLAAERGAHVMIADRDLASAELVAEECGAIAGNETASSTIIDIRSRDAIKRSLEATIAQFGGLDILINTAATSPSLSDVLTRDAQSPQTLGVNIASNHLLADEAQKVFKAQGLDASIVLTGPANAVAAERGSEGWEAGLSHLVRELAVSMAPLVRVNGFSGASGVDPRDCAEAILFLAGPLARGITGHLIPVDSGPIKASLR
jgi:rhamnose utilization protein RhaD (predicted bifunctional aldolase and dehydrogenase)/NAD(P)-dependent dehydrogenase (short-subunit alcohol dehydrogenase family)